MADLVNASAQAIADALAPSPQAPAARWRWGSVVSVNADGTMNVSIGGATVPSIRCAQHVMGAQVGDRVRVLYCGTECMVDAVRATEPDAPYYENFGDYVNLYCYGHVAILTVVKEVVLNGSWASADICTVPEGYRPQYDLYAAATLQDISTGNFTLYIQPDGQVQAKVRGGTSPGSSAHFVMGTLVWSY